MHGSGYQRPTTRQAQGAQRSRINLARGVAALALASAHFASAAHAEADFPDKPLRLLIGFPAGSTADIIARNFTGPLATALGQPVVVEVVAKAAPDGHTLLLSTIANTINPALYRLSFDFTRDITGVAMLAESNALLIAAMDAPRTLAEAIATAKAKPDALQFGSSGNGTFTHLYGELLNLSAGVQIGHVPYRGSTQVLTDIMAGRLSLGFITAAPVLASIKANRARALATTGTRRSSALPDVPTFSESGVAGFEAGLWFGLNTTAGTPRATIERLNREVVRIMGTPEMREVLARQGIDPTPSSAQAFDTFITQDTAKWARVVKAAGVRAD